MTQHWRRRRDNWLGFDESNSMRAMHARERAVAFTLHAVNARHQHTYTLESEGGWLAIICILDSSAARPSQPPSLSIV